MVEFTRYWMGPLGRLRQLPMVPVDGEVDLALARIGGEHESLTGGVTLDTVAHKREWSMDWECLTREEAAPLRSAFLRLRRDPLRLIDPREVNRLSKDGSSGASYSRSSLVSHRATAGPVSVVQPLDYPDDIADQIDSAVDWSVPTAATESQLQIDSTPTARVPVILGEPVTVSMLVRGTGQVQVGFIGWSAADPPIPAAARAAAVTLTGGWQWLSHTYAFQNSVSAAALLSAPAGAARTITVGPTQIEAGPVRTDWTPGLGCPRVAISDSDYTLPGVGLHLGLELTVREL